MMYKLETVLENIGGTQCFFNEVLITNIHPEKIKILDVNSFKVISTLENHYSFTMYEDIIIDSDVNIYNLSGEILLSSFDKKLILSCLNKNGIALLNQIVKWEKIGTKFHIESQHHLFDLNTKQFIKKDIQNFNGGATFIQGEFFVLRQKGKLTVFDYNQEQVIWERDFSEEFAYEDPISLNKKWRKAEIGKLYQYGNDKLIVTAGFGNSFCLDLKTGKQIWHKKYPGFYIIQGDTAFVYTNGGSIAKVDLKTGEILSNEGTFYRFPDLPPVKHKRLGEIHISPHGTEMVFHEDSLWFVVHSNGYSFVVKINPNTFEYEWIHQVDTPEEVRSIQFYKNKMYLHDLSHQLHVYTKE